MLPEKLSTDITSLGFNEDRLVIVIEVVVGDDGFIQTSDIYRACVRNQAKLAYNSVAAWLEGGAAPAAVATVPGLDENLRLQDKAAQRMKDRRQVHGALTFESLEARPIFDGDVLRGLETEPRQGSDCGFHDRRQWRDGPLSFFTQVRFLATCGSDTETMGSDCRDCPAARIQAPQ
jgi:exoribonuclease-2